MAIGPGKYDQEVTQLREQLKADGIMLVVIRGSRGSGFSAQLSLADTVDLPKALRDMAEQMEKSGGTA